MGDIERDKADEAAIAVRGTIADARTACRNIQIAIADRIVVSLSN